MTTSEPLTLQEDAPLDDIVNLMEKNSIKRLPIVRGDRMVGIVTRSDLLRAFAGLAREIPDSTADDAHIRDRVIRQIGQNEWRPLNLQVTAHNGMVHLYGVITDYRARDAAIVAVENIAGAKEVHDHLCWIETYSGAYLHSDEDEAAARSKPG